MLRVRASEVHARIPLTAALVLATLLLAVALSAAAVYQVFEEYSLLGTWLATSRPVPAAEIRALRQDIGARIILRSAASAVLLLCTVATLWLQQRQFAVRRALDQIKVFAGDVLGSMDQGVITTDSRNLITSMNSAAIRILGVESDCVGQPIARLSSDGEPLLHLADSVAQRHVAIWDQDFNIDRGGRVRRIRAHAHVLKDAAGEALGCLMLLRDVSDRVLMEERVRRMERFLSLGTLASGLHHEIKNPLTALSIHVQLLEKRLRDPEPKGPAHELIGVLKSEVLRLNGVLERFRNFANLQRLNVRPADVCAILAEITGLIRPQADQQKVEITLRPSERGLRPVPLDAEKFKQGVLNLVINALEAMPEGGELAVGAATRAGELVVEISDTGPGIAPEIQENLFKPYFSTKNRGTGMGLALTEKLVSQHAGRIDFRTSAQGTTFYIVIPLEPGLGANGEP